MSVPKNTTPRPFSSYRDDDTPAWMAPVRRDTPGFGARAKKTMLAQPGQQYTQHDPDQERRPISDKAHFYTRETCWDCGGTGRSGAILYRCPVCGCSWTWAQIEAKAGERGPRDEWGAVRLPCVRECGKVPSNRLYRIYEPCRTCYDPNDRKQVERQRGKGYLDVMRPIDEIAQYIAARVAKALGISRAINLAEAVTLPVPMFQQSEPTAPVAPLEHPAVHAQPHIPERFTPHLPPLSPDDPKEF